jgi:inner membrane protein
MDPLTHALLGMLVALAVEPARMRPGFVGRRPRLAAGAVAGVFPDLAWLTSVGNPLAVLGDAITLTHSLLFAPVFALLIAAVFSMTLRRPLDWPVFLAVTGPALLVHLGVDLLTSGGLQPWYPVVATRYAAA